MKISILLGVLALMTAGNVRASLYTETFTVSGGTIPDGNPNGVLFSGSVSDIPAGDIIFGMTVGLNVSGGYNGDLYAYVVAPNGTLVVLLNQPGVSGSNFGASGAGMNITLQDGTSDHGLIQSETSGSVLSGSYNAAGTLANFNGAAADGTWNLFFADLSSGGGTSTLNGWSLNIEAVPEPVTVALGIFGGLLGGVALARHHAAKRRSVLQPPT